MNIPIYICLNEHTYIKDTLVKERHIEVFILVRDKAYFFIYATKQTRKQGDDLE